MTKKIKQQPIHPDDWKTGTVKATTSQKEELKALKQPVPENLSKAGAAQQIETIKKTNKKPATKK